MSRKAVSRSARRLRLRKLDEIERKLDALEREEYSLMLEEFEAVRLRDFDAAQSLHKRRGACLEQHLDLLQLRDAALDCESTR